MGRARGGAEVPRALQQYQRESAIRLSAEVLADPVRALARDFVAAESPRTDPHAPDLTDRPSDASPNRAETPSPQIQIALAYSNRDVAALNDTIRAARRQKASRMAQVRESAGSPSADTGTAMAAFDLRTERDYGMIMRAFADHDGARRVYTVKRLLAVGDRVMTTEALPERGVAKSSFGTLVATRADGITVQFDGDDHTVALTMDDLPALDYGYAATIHKSQGLSADAVYVLPHRRMHRHATYVALSRHRDRLSIYGRVGHMETLADLIRLGQAPGHLDMDPDDLDRLIARLPVPERVPQATDTGLGQRSDWQALTTGHTDQPTDRSLSIGSVIDDPSVMAVAERVAGLMAATSRGRTGAVRPLVPDGLSDAQRRYLSEPTRVIDDLITRSSVFRADDIADRLSAVVTDPDTFLRLFTQALLHPDLITLASADDHGTLVYSTRAQVRKDVQAVDRGTRLALAGASAAAPRATLADLFRKDWRVRMHVRKGLSEDQRQAVDLAMDPGRLRLIRGAPGAGKTHTAVELARLHAAAGWTVVTLAPTGAGLSALEVAGMADAETTIQPMTVRRFLTQTETKTDVPIDVGADGDAQGAVPKMDGKTVVILDDATRLGGAETAAILERVEASGAKLVAMLGGEEHTPLGAGPVMRALEMRVGSIDLRTSRDPERAAAITGLLTGGEAARAVLHSFGEGDQLVAGGDARRAITVLADSYLQDSVQDKIVLTWSRSDAQAVTKAIRTRLDAMRPERRATPKGRFRSQHPMGDLKVGDRIRFETSTPWRPTSQRDRGWSQRRLRAGERAEVQAVDAKTGALTLRVTGRDGTSTRDVVLPVRSTQRSADVPKWCFAFAGTIHGDGALVRESVHLLASPGMTRPILAAGVAAHRDHLKIVVPSAAPRTVEVLERIVRRNGRAESVLDFGFDPTLGARAALEASREEPDKDGKDGAKPTPDTARSRLSGALERLAQVAGLTPSREHAPLPSEAVRHVMAEVMGARADVKGGGSVDLDAADQKVLESLVRKLSHRTEWRRLLRQVPSNLPRDADALADAYAGPATDESVSRATSYESTRLPPMTVARYLARGALTARALGEDRVAHVFETALIRFGARAETARITGHLERLEPRREGMQPTDPARTLEAAPGQSRSTIDGSTKDATAIDHPINSPQDTRRTRLPAGEVMDIRDTDRTGRNPETTAPERRPDAPRQEAPVAGAERARVYDERALQLAVAISDRVEATHPVHRRNLIADVRKLLEDADDMTSVNPEHTAEREREIVRQRVTLDTQRDLARAIVAHPPPGHEPQPFHEDLFLTNITDPRRSLNHPLELEHTVVQKAYDAQVEDAVKQALAHGPPPTAIERSVAIAVAIPMLSWGREDLVEASKKVFERGSLQPPGPLMAQRKALIRDLCGLRERLEPRAAQSRMADLYRSFTHREIDAIRQPKTAWPDTLPPVSDKQRQALVRGLKTLMEPLGEGYGAFYPWKAAAKTIENSLHPGRGRSRSRGLGL